MTRQLLRTLVTAAVAVFVLSIAVPASAQTGALRGKVVDKDGKPVDMAEVLFEFVGDIKRSSKTITDKNGEWVRAGLPVGGGTWTITAKKHDLAGSVERITVKINEATVVPNIVLMTEADRKKGVKASVSAEDAAAMAKKNAETDKLLEETNAAIAAGNHDEAITKLKSLIERLTADRNDRCAPCHAKLGDIYVLKKDTKEAEAAFLLAIELDPTKPGPYNALASLYNEQRKFDEASKMSAKATELMGASGSTDPSALFNQGVIFWNQGKIPEAKAQWAKAVELDAKMAEAHYWLGMANVNQGNVADAKKNFNTYLELAPKGQYADTAKAILASIK